MQASISPLIPRARVKASIEVVVRQQGESFTQTIHRYSRHSDVVFLGLSVPKPGAEADYAQKLSELVTKLKTTILVHNGETTIPVLLSLEI